MTGPIDVAYVQVEPSFAGFNADLDRGVREASRQLDDGFAEAGSRAGTKFAEAFHRDAQGRLRDAQGRFVKDGERIADALGLGAQQNQSGFQRALDSIANGVTGIVGKIRAMPLAFSFAIASSLQFLVPLAGALSSVIGLIAAIPAGIAVGGAGIATLIVGFSGFAEALKKTHVAGGGAVDTLNLVSDAEYRLSQAQRQRAHASEDVARATQNATRELEDLNRAVRNGVEDEQSAQLALERAIRNVRGTRGLDRREARLAVDEARSNLDDVRARNVRNAEDLRDAQKKGVQGSDQVVAAREAEASAIHSVAEAQQALTKAQQGGGGGGGIDAQAAALAALAPAARSVAKEIIALQPRFDEFRKSVQQALFEPLEGDATKFADITLPHIEDGMKKVAGTIGEGISSLLEKLSTPRAGEFFDKIFASADRVLKSIGPGAEKFFTAIGKAIEEGLPFIEKFGDKFGEGLGKIADFITTSIEDGSFQEFFDQAVRTMQDLGPLLMSIGGFLKEVFLDPNVIAAGRAIIETFTALFDIASAVANFFLTDLPNAIGEFRLAAGQAIVDVMKFVSDIPDNLGKMVGRFIKAGKDLITGFFEGLSNGPVGDLARNIGNAVKGVLNQVIAGINFSIGVIDDVLPMSLPRIPQLAKGGMATGATLAMIGEGAHDEVVLPLGDPRTMAALQAATGGGGGQTIMFGPGSVSVSFDGSVPSEGEARRTGAAVGRGILDVLAARNVATQVRTV